MQGLKLRVPIGGLLSRIGGLFKRGNGLGKKAKDLADRSKKVKDKADKITAKAKDLLNELGARESAIKDLEDKLQDLAKQQKELTDKLEDRPRKILEELTTAVADVEEKAQDLSNKAEKENEQKDKVLQDMDELAKQKEALEQEQDQLEKEYEGLQQEQGQLAKEVADVQKEAAAAQAEDKKLDDLVATIDALTPDQSLEKELADCASELKDLLLKSTGLEEKQNKFKDKLKKWTSWPSKMLGKLTNLKGVQDQLKLPKNGIPIADKAMGKVAKLLGKASNLSSMVELLTGKKSKLQKRIEQYDQQFDQVKSQYDAKTADLDALKGELITLVAEKTGLKGALDQTVQDVAGMESKVTNFVNRYHVFEEKAECQSKEGIKKIIDLLKKGQEETEPEMEELEEEIEEVNTEEQQLEEETQKVKQEIEEQQEQAAELKQEEEAIKEEFGNDVSLESVTTEEWAESFEVERPYWDAVFHPDDEVVEGFKGRYFEVRLKDANQNVKLLFGPGEYFKSKSDFRKSYGSTIGSFVTEALHAMKKTDQGKVKLFIQGSADIASHETFSGKLDERFFFEEVTVLPQKEAEDERFEGEAVRERIPGRNFRNEHLPNLRAQYLKEMIGAYSKKFDPILLEGAVKSFQDEEERNDIIYLFIPEELLAEYEDR